MAKLGSFGGKATLKKYGPDHFRKAIAARWAKRKAVKSPTITKGGNEK